MKEVGKALEGLRTRADPLLWQVDSGGQLVPDRRRKALLQAVRSILAQVVQEEITVAGGGGGQDLDFIVVEVVVFVVVVALVFVVDGIMCH